MKSPMPVVHVRMPASLRDVLQHRAKTLGRSMSSEMCAALTISTVKDLPMTYAMTSLKIELDAHRNMARATMHALDQVINGAWDRAALLRARRRLAAKAARIEQRSAVLATEADNASNHEPMAKLRSVGALLNSWAKEREAFAEEQRSQYSGLAEGSQAIDRIAVDDERRARFAPSESKALKASATERRRLRLLAILSERGRGSKGVLAEKLKVSASYVSHLLATPQSLQSRPITEETARDITDAMGLKRGALDE
jgi:hypothetical protein